MKIIRTKKREKIVNERGSPVIGFEEGKEFLLIAGKPPIGSIWIPFRKSRLPIPLFFFFFVLGQISRPKRAGLLNPSTLWAQLATAKYHFPGFWVAYHDPKPSRAIWADICAAGSTIQYQYQCLIGSSEFIIFRDSWIPTSSIIAWVTYVNHGYSLSWSASGQSCIFPILKLWISASFLITIHGSYDDSYYFYSYRQSVISSLPGARTLLTRISLSDISSYPATSYRSFS